MPRSIRQNTEGGWYHITTRGLVRQRIFRDDRDRGRFVELPAETVKQAVAAVKGEAWEEFVAGTDPTNAASVFQFTAASALPPGPRRPLGFDSVPGRRYRVSVSTNLLFDDWQAGLFAGSTNGPLLPGPCTATGGATTIFVEPSTMREFYRGSVER